MSGRRQTWPQSASARASVFFVSWFPDRTRPVTLTGDASHAARDDRSHGSGEGGKVAHRRRGVADCRIRPSGAGRCGIHGCDAATISSWTILASAKRVLWLYVRRGNGARHRRHPKHPCLSFGMDAGPESDRCLRASMRASGFLRALRGDRAVVMPGPGSNRHARLTPVLSPIELPGMKSKRPSRAGIPTRMSLPRGGLSPGRCPAWP